MTGLESKRETELFRIQKEASPHSFEFNIRKPAQAPTKANLPPTPSSEEILDRLLSNALLLIDNADYKSATKILTNILARDSHYAEAIEWLAYCFKQQGDLENAHRCLSELVRICPDETSFALLADLLYEKGHFADAENYYRSALGLINYDSPLLFGIYKNLGNIFVSSGDFEGAEEYYNKAYTICPHSDALLVNFGTLEVQKGHFDKALEHYREAVKLNSQNEKAWIGIALIHRSKGDFELAWGNLERALDINPSNKTAIKLLAQWGFEELKSEVTIERLESYMEKNDQDVDVSLILVEALYRKGEVGRARLELVRAASIDPTRAEVQRYHEILG